MIVAGFEILSFEELKSTNDKAMEISQLRSGQKIAIFAQRQTEGRGRLGRVWQSLDGNLFCSILLEFALENLGTLVMISALSLLETIKSYGSKAKVQIKWPNDVLLNEAKVSGILLEKGAGEYMIIGVGVNIAQSPQNDTLMYAATSLREAGIFTTAEEFLYKYLTSLSQNLQNWQNQGTAVLRQKWLANAKGIGQKIIVRQNGKELCGIFDGIDENADLILRIDDKMQKIMAGDVFYTKREK